MTVAVSDNPTTAQTEESRPPTVVTASVTTSRGRYVIDSPGKAFVSDSSSREGGSVAPGPGDLLNSALAVCALGSVQRHAAEQSLPVGPATVAVVTATRNEAKPTQFKLVHIEVYVDGVEQPAAEDLVGKFTASCPIFNTVRRGGPVAVEVVTDSGRRIILENSNDWQDPA